MLKLLVGMYSAKRAADKVRHEARVDAQMLRYKATIDLENRVAVSDQFRKEATFRMAMRPLR